MKQSSLRLLAELTGRSEDAIRKDFEIDGGSMKRGVDCLEYVKRWRRDGSTHVQVGRFVEATVDRETGEVVEAPVVLKPRHVNASVSSDRQLMERVITAALPELGVRPGDVLQEELMARGMAAKAAVLNPDPPEVVPDGKCVSCGSHTTDRVRNPLTKRWVYVCLSCQEEEKNR